MQSSALVKANRIKIVNPRLNQIVAGAHVFYRILIRIALTIYVSTT